MIKLKYKKIYYNIKYIFNILSIIYIYIYIYIYILWVRSSRP
ncbi:hypothetical protein ACMBCM_06925 [Spiroplasma sp. K1]